MLPSPPLTDPDVQISRIRFFTLAVAKNFFFVVARNDDSKAWLFSAVIDGLPRFYLF